jgi:hypothetical protein
MLQQSALVALAFGVWWRGGGGQREGEREAGERQSGGGAARRKRRRTLKRSLPSTRMPSVTLKGHAPPPAVRGNSIAAKTNFAN